MHICLLSVEIFAWGKFGGFGRATRTIGRELVKRGLEVTAIIPRRQDQAAIEYLDGIKVLGFDMADLPGMVKIFKDCEADIYHSEEPSFGTYLSWKFHPEKTHIVTFRDTRLFSDWLTEFRLPSLNKLQVLKNWIYEDNFLVHQAIRKANHCFVAANLLKQRAVKKYRLMVEPDLLPTPVTVPEKIDKASKPTVCYTGRWDRRKRPELILPLAEAFPHVHFLLAGSSRDKKFDQALRRLFGKLPNIELTGFINQYESDRLSDVFSQSWILINTSAREGLPNAFIEACAHGCAILSEVDPDGFASNFGYCASDGNFIKGLQHLLDDNHWEKKGQIGRQYVKDTYDMEVAIAQHIRIYNELLSMRS